VGTIELRVPRDREGTFRTELFERYQRSEQALVVALMEMVVNGVSTRKVKRITERLCGHAFSKSTVSELVKGLDAQLEAWNERDLSTTSYPFVWVDAMGIKVRREGAVRPTSLLLITAVNAEGHREILGLRVADSESEAGWLETFRWLKERGLAGVEFVVSDDHRGLVAALKRAFQGAIWQRCQVHFMKNVLDATPKPLHAAMHRSLVRILEADSAASAREAFAALAAELESQAARALQTLESGLEDAIAVLALPEKYRRRLRSTNMLERLIEEARRRERVIRIFPNERSAWRLMGALLAEQHEEWVTGRRYFDMIEYFDWKAAQQSPDARRKAA
jgi:transposase-like protein